MRILLISLNRETEPFTAAPLGLALVAGALERAGHEVRALDLLFSGRPEDEIREAVKLHRPEMVGLSLRNIESSTEFLLPAYRDVAALLKEVCAAPVVVGGPGFSIMPEQVLDYLGLDFGIAGEGEQAAVEFARAVADGTGPAAVSGVCYRTDGVISSTPKNNIEDLSANPAPAWGHFPVKEYDMVGVQSKRGCSFSCVYCTYPSLEGRRMRLIDPVAVADGIASLRDTHGIGSFYFVDNVFNNPKPHAEEVCRELAARGPGLEWAALVTPAGLDAGFARSMRDAGCASVEIGADSLSARALSGLGKPFSPENVADAVRNCRDAGLMSMLFLILGGPGEDEDTLQETFEALDRISPDKVFAVAGIRIYPGAPLAKTAVEEGVIGRDDNLLMPRFYVSEKLGERLYDLAGGYFRKHPEWICYEARGVMSGGAAKPAASAAPGWGRDAQDCLDLVISEVPRLIRPMAKKAAVRKAGLLAAERGLALVTPAEVRDAFISETPGPFRASMKNSLVKFGLLDG